MGLDVLPVNFNNAVYAEMFAKIVISHINGLITPSCCPRCCNVCEIIKDLEPVGGVESILSVLTVDWYYSLIWWKPGTGLDYAWLRERWNNCEHPKTDAEDVFGPLWRDS